MNRGCFRHVVVGRYRVIAQLLLLFAFRYRRTDDSGYHGNETAVAVTTRHQHCGHIVPTRMWWGSCENCRRRGPRCCSPPSPALQLPAADVAARERWRRPFFTTHRPSRRRRRPSDRTTAAERFARDPVADAAAADVTPRCRLYGP